MRKFLICFAVLFALIIPPPAQAGSANCSGTTVISSPGDYAATTECIFSVETPLTSLGYARFRLPNNPSTGDEFTLNENSEFVTDSYFNDWDYSPGQWIEYTYTGGVGFSASHWDATLQQFVPNANLIYYADYGGAIDEASTFSPGQYLKVVFDGTYWQLSGSGL